MTNPWRRVVPALLLCACQGPPAGAGKGGPEPAKAPAKVDAKDGKVEVVVDGKVDTKAPPVVVPPPVAGGEDWLVWWRVDRSWTTRWVHVAGEKAEPVGERGALVVGDGARAWLVERADGKADVKGCDCLEAESDEAKCPPTGTIVELGLRARELTGDGVIDVRKADNETEFGEDILYTLAIQGGAQAKLVIGFGMSGYFCGAHGLSEGVVSMFDLAAGKSIDDPFGDWVKRLPEPLRTGAAEAMKADYVECDNADATTQQIRDEVMTLEDVSVSLVAGAPKITWQFAAEVMYACSADYMVVGNATSGLLPEAAPLGLAGPLPPGVEKVFKEIGTADTVGFSRLELPPEARAAAIVRFNAIPGGAWPPGEANSVDLAVPNAAQARIDEGRKFTREKKFSEAIAAFDKAIEADATLASAYSGRGYARLLALDLKKAREDFEAALKRDSKPQFQAAVLFNLGQVAEKTGDRKAAKAAYEKSLALRETKQVKAALAALAAAGP